MAAEQDPPDGPAQIPPIDANQVPPLERVTVWPRKLGIFSFVWGGCGAAASVLTLMSVYAMRHNPQVIEQIARNDAQKEFMQSPLIVNWLTAWSLYNGLCILLAMVLLACGIGLLGRRTWAVKVLLAWAAIRLILEVGSTCLDYVMHMKITQAIAQGMLEAENVPGLFQVWSTKAVVVGLVISCALPVFVLTWLARAEIREEVAAWR